MLDTDNNIIRRAAWALNVDKGYIHTFRIHNRPIYCFYTTMVTPKLWRTQEFCSGGVQQIQLRTEDRENGDLGVVAPLVRGSGGSCNLVQEI